MELVERSLQSIEWPDFLNYYKGLCLSPAASAVAPLLAAPANREKSETLLNLTSEASYLDGQQAFGFLGNLHSLEAHFELLTKQACLSTNELHEIHHLVLAGVETKGLLKKEDSLKHAPSYCAEFARIEDLNSIASRIGSVIDIDGEIREDASEKLFKLFRRREKTRASAQSTIQRELKKAQSAKHSQDSYFDIRDGKFVLPIRSEMQSEFQGSIIERSASKATVFMEPAGMRDINNELSKIDQLIEEEIYRILREISNYLSPYADNLNGLYYRLRDLDLGLARAKAAKNLGIGKPCIRPKFGATFKINEFFHPLLRIVLDESEIVTNDIDLEQNQRGILISGPNTGGKTVLLKSLGLICQMAKCGFFVPASDVATIPYFQNILSHIGDEQSIELSLSSFSSSALIMKEILKVSDESTLVLVDEIFASTDPSEGAALAAACIKGLVVKGATTIITTHFSELKSLSEEESQIINASMQFDQVELVPKFKLVLGVPGKSWALETAQRFGFDPDLIKTARDRLGTQHLEVESLIKQLHKDESEAQKEVQHIKALKLNIEKERDELNRTTERLRERVRTIRTELQEEYGVKFRAVMRKAEGLIDKYKELLKDSPSIHKEMADAKSALQEAKDSFQQSFKGSEHEPEPIESVETKPIRTPESGDTVVIKSSGIKGTLLNSKPDKKATVQAGILKVRLDWDEITLHESSSQRASGYASSQRKKGASSGIDNDCPPEINLIGLAIDEAIPRLEEYLDKFSRSNRPSGRIIHGHGSGKLKRFVRDFLRESPYGFSFRPGDDNEGGDGCTVVLESEA